MKLIRMVFVVLLTFAGYASPAQAQVEMADTLRSEGKIYVVVAILLVIFIGIIYYLITIDRKVSRLENKFPGKKA